MSSKLNRRSLLIRGSAALSATAWFQHWGDFAIASLREDEFGGFPIGAQSYSLRSFNLVEAIRHLQGMGLHFVELYSKHMPVNAQGKQLEEIQQVLAQAEIKLAAHGVSGFTNEHEKNRLVFEFARRAGIRNITANPQPEAFDSLDKLCEEYDVRIAIHNHGPGALYDKISDVKKAVKDRHPNVGACIDTGHFIRSKEDPVQAIYDLKGRVFGLHIKDEEKQEKNSHNVIIGTGHLDLVGMFRALKKTDFPADGGLSLEYEANPQNPIDDMKQCLVAAKEAIAKVATS